MKNTPHISVDGRASVRVVPDRASISFSVSRREPKPAQAFAAVRAVSSEVNKVLDAFALEYRSMSRVRLEQQTRVVDGKERNLGYRAELGCSLLLADLEQLEPLLTQLVDAGVDRLGNVTLKASNLESLRAQARHEAVVNAMQKASTCAEAANARCGKVLLIEQGAESLPSPAGSDGRRSRTASVGGAASIEPGSIEVSAAVHATFELLSE